jgi:multidrug efflux pump subunit AcrA (membrane-fusion protein)
MTANLQITVDETNETLWIPKQALLFGKSHADRQSSVSSGDSPTVWVLDAESKPSPVRVRVGKSDDVMTQVLSDALAEGQHVIIGAAAPATMAGPFGLRWRW